SRGFDVARWSTVWRIENPVGLYTESFEVWPERRRGADQRIGRAIRKSFHPGQRAKSGTATHEPQHFEERGPQVAHFQHDWHAATERQPQREDGLRQRRTRHEHQVGSFETSRHREGVAHERPVVSTSSLQEITFRRTDAMPAEAPLAPL